jgi:hypothetical protein
MKMKAIFAVVALGALTLASCRKDYECWCGDGSTEIKVASYTNVKKATAEASCTTWETYYSGDCSVK